MKSSKVSSILKKLATRDGSYVLVLDRGYNYEEAIIPVHFAHEFCLSERAELFDPAISEYQIGEFAVDVAGWA